MKPYSILLACALVVAACNNSDSVAKNVTNTDTLQEVVVDDEIAVVRQSFPQLFQYLKQQDNTFSEDSFSLSGEDVVEPIDPTPIDSTHLKPFQKYLIYNRDSSLAIDLYSYNYLVTNQDGQSRLEEAGPDSEAAVLDLKRGTRRRVFFGGPLQTLWDAKWTGLDELLLIGAEAHGDGILIPTIWKVNLRDSSMQVFAYQGQVKADMNNYTAQKLGMSF